MRIARPVLARLYLVAGGLLIGTGLFLGAYASLHTPLISALVASYLASGILFSEAFSSDKPYFYVLASALLAITIGCSILMPDIMLVPSGVCSVLGPILVSWGLRELRREGAKP